MLWSKSDAHLRAARVGGAEIGEYKIRGNICGRAGHLQVIGGNEKPGKLRVPPSLPVWAESR